MIIFEVNKVYKGIIYIKEQLLTEEMSQKNEVGNSIASLQKRNYLLVIVSDAPYELIQKPIRENFNTFICLNGQQIIFKGKFIRNQFLPLQEVKELLKISVHAKNSLMLYKKDKIIWVNKELTNQEQVKKEEHFFTSLCNNPEPSNVYLVKIFNQKRRKDIIYEDLFEHSFSFRRINEECCIMGTLGINFEEARGQLQKKINGNHKMKTYFLAEKFILLSSKRYLIG